MSDDRTAWNGHYYVGASTGKRHLVVAARTRHGPTAHAVCGHELRVASVRVSEGLREPEWYLDKYGDQLCAHCVRWTLEDPELKWREQQIQEAEEREARERIREESL